MFGGYNYDIIRNIVACDAVEVLKSQGGGWRNHCFGLYLRNSCSDYNGISLFGFLIEYCIINLHNNFI